MNFNLSEGNSVFCKRICFAFIAACTVVLAILSQGAGINGMGNEEVAKKYSEYARRVEAAKEVSLNRVLRALI